MWLTFLPLWGKWVTPARPTMWPPDLKDADYIAALKSSMQTRVKLLTKVERMLEQKIEQKELFTIKWRVE